MKNVELYEKFCDEAVELAIRCYDSELYSCRDLVTRISACGAIIHLGGVSNDVIAMLYDTALVDLNQIKKANNRNNIKIDEHVGTITALIDELYNNRYTVLTTPDKEA